MIFCFSGTGNSRYVAKRLSEAIGDNITDLNVRIKNKDYSSIDVNGNLIIVTPTYAWRVPHVVFDFLDKTTLHGVKNVWFVMTCGGEIGDAAKYNIRFCDKNRFCYMGTFGIVMPENYIAMFDAPEKTEAERIVKNAEPKIDTAISYISENKAFPMPRRNLYDRFMSDGVNGIFYKFCVKSKAFAAGNKCVGCGKCVSLCPLGNITLINGKPVWGDNCTHCMACICYCPTEAIEYGTKSKNKPRYTFEKLK